MVPSIRGLRYIPDYIDSETHDHLLTDVDAPPWLPSSDHRVQIYGYGYHHATRSASRIGELPAWVLALANRLRDDQLFPQLPNQMVANDYPPGAGIFPHVDQGTFGDTVVSVSLGSTCVMRFTHHTAGQTEELLLEPRSALILTSDARWVWHHEIPARTSDTWMGTERPRARRVSLTFRVVPEPGSC